MHGTLFRSWKMILKSHGLVGMLLLSVSPMAVGAPVVERSVGMDVGMVHPDFRLPTLEGGFDRLSDHRGKKVLLIHFASW